MPLPAIDLWMRFVPGTPLKQNKKNSFSGDTPRKIHRRFHTTASPGGQGKNVYCILRCLAGGRSERSAGGKGGVYLGDGFPGKNDPGASRRELRETASAP